MEALGESVGLAKLSAAQEEDVLGDVPEDFSDPLLGTIMQARHLPLPSACGLRVVWPTRRASAAQKLSFQMLGICL